MQDGRTVELLSRNCVRVLQTIYTGMRSGSWGGTFQTAANNAGKAKAKAKSRPSQKGGFASSNADVRCGMHVHLRVVAARVHGNAEVRWRIQGGGGGVGGGG